MTSFNWAGNVKFTHQTIAYPSTEREIQQLVLKAANDGKRIRTIGSGHSFTRLCQTKDVLLSLDKYQGLVRVDHQTNRATVKAGTKLHTLGELLYHEGLAMENLGDIDVQSIAGAISTGTHGTGTQFGTISTQLVSIRFVNGRGEIVTCSATEQPDVFRAAQISLGTLGVITELTVQCVPSYKLMIENRKESLRHVLGTLEERKHGNRNFEFYWMPYTDTAWTKASNIVGEGEPQKDTLANYLSELVLENYSFKALCEFARAFPSQNQRVSRIAAQAVPTINKLNHSHKVFATMRMVRFTEMEYNVPAEAYDEVMKEVVSTVNSGNFSIHFPIESRWVQQDDILLSPAYGRDSAYVACHVYHKKDNRKYFEALEAIFKAHGGRPHWGKMNTLRRSDIVERYPKFSEFDAIRQQQDPGGVFLNGYLQELFG